MKKMKGAALIAAIILALVAGLTQFVAQTNHTVNTDGGQCVDNGASS